MSIQAFCIARNNNKLCPKVLNCCVIRYLTFFFVVYVLISYFVPTEFICFFEYSNLALFSFYVYHVISVFSLVCIHKFENAYLYDFAFSVSRHCIYVSGLFFRFYVFFLFSAFNRFHTFIPTFSSSAFPRFFNHISLQVFISIFAFSKVFCILGQLGIVGTQLMIIVNSSWFGFPSESE